MWPTDGAFLFFANLPSEGCAKNDPAGNSPQRTFLRALRGISGACSRQNSPFRTGSDLLVSVSSKPFFCDVMRCFRHISRVIGISAMRNLGICSGISPKKKAIVPALNFIMRYRKRRSPDLYFDFFPNFRFSGAPRIMINERDEKRRIAFPGFYAVNSVSEGNQKKFLRIFLS